MTVSSTRASRRSGGGDDAGRATDLRLASLHLRVGMLTLARAELESMAGEGTLDDHALLDLGEARWRTGDLAGAGDAAAAYLDTGQETTLALVIAAEAQAALGRPAEARRLANRALDRADGSLDALFAGMPRAGLWPADGEGGEAVVTAPHGPDVSEASGPVSADAPAPASGASSTPSSSVAGAGASAIAAVTHQPVALPDGQTQLDAARAALEAGDTEAAALRLAIVLRVAPVLAPAVLEAAASAPGPSLDLVRGDAFRLLGREIAARRLFLGAIDALDDRASSPVADGGVDAAPVLDAVDVRADAPADARADARADAPEGSPPSRTARPADGQVPLPFGVPSDGSDPSASTEPEAS